MKKAFTLAEVLITLGIIGVVAAMTLPTLIQSYKKSVVETKLAWFYSAMNQAVRLSDVENGEFALSEGEYSIEEFYNKYLAPYIKTVKTEKIDEYSILVYFPNGSAMNISNLNGNSSPHISYLPFGSYNDATVFGKDSFFFIFRPSNYKDMDFVLYPYGIQPYSWSFKTGWKGLTDEEINDELMNDTTAGCKGGDGGYCTALIMRNGWTIPDDYPYKF